MIPQTGKHKYGAVSLNQTLNEKVTCATLVPVVPFVDNSFGVLLETIPYTHT